MSTTKVVIVEDEKGALNVLKSMLEEYGQGFELLDTAGNVKEGIKKINDLNPDLVFLDIRLPDGDSFEILENCKKTDFEVVFTTAYGEYREKAFDYFALNYLTKPIDVDKFEETLDHYKKRTENAFNQEKLQFLQQLLNDENLSGGKGPKKIAIPTREGYTLIKVEEIVHCEAESNYTNIFLASGEKYVTSKSLKHYDELLSGGEFYRVHKSHLVNINFVKKVNHDGTIELTDGTFVSLSQRTKKAFLQYLERMT